MAKTPRRAVPKTGAAKKAPARKRKAPVLKAEPWRRLVFADLHVETATLDIALSVLEQVGALAEEHDAAPTCLGDFWHLRGHWLVRQVDAVLQRIAAMRGGYFIPGNHDQVSLDGKIHGMNIFEGFDQHVVCTDMVIDEKSRIAYLPWREIPAEQQAQLAALEYNAAAPYTIFGHAEVGGATSNGGHTTPGIIQVKDIERVARAAYFGHYHKRQKLGERSWYIGSPYQRDAGERDWPHGVALITSENPEPQFIELEGFRKYYRLELDGDWDAAALGITENDVVELVATPEQIGSEEYLTAVDELPALDVRAKAASEPDAAYQPPEFALTLDAAVEAHASSAFEAEFTGSGDNTLTLEEITAAGRDILGEIPEARVIPLLGKNVRLVDVYTEDFCTLRGKLTFPVSEYSRALIEAPVRTGKTALLDAPGWCLYGQTTPRKPGATGASLTADGVIHDDAGSCVVMCTFQVDDKCVTVRREKKRGSGSKVTFDGIDHPDGIKDHDALVRHIVGLPYSLWRACVSMGQGAVANFATNADKSRKELLNGAFGLECCPKAAERAKFLRNRAQQDEVTLGTEILTLTTQRDALLAQDLTSQSDAWEQRKAASVAGFQATSIAEAEEAGKCLALLEGEQAWLDTKARHDSHIEERTTALVALRPGPKIGELQRQYGAQESEHALAVRDLNRAQEELRGLVEGGAAAACPTCGQALPPTTHEQYLNSAERKVSAAQANIGTFDTRLNNIRVELHALNTGGNEESQAIEGAIAESREALKKCDEAVTYYQRIRTNQEGHLSQQAEADRRGVAAAAEENPFAAQIQVNATRIADMQTSLDTKEADRGAAQLTASKYQVWVDGFGPKGIPVLVLRTALYDLESAANKHLADLLAGTVYCKLSMVGEDLKIHYYEVIDDGRTRERVYEQLSGGQRRCVEFAFTPLALGDMIFARLGVKIELLSIDELTTHMGDVEKAAACALLERLDRATVLVADHDIGVKSHFDTRLRLQPGAAGYILERI